MASKGRTSKTKAGAGKTSGGTGGTGGTGGGNGGGGTGTGRKHTTPTITSTPTPTITKTPDKVHNGISTNASTPSANPYSKTQAGGRGTSIFAQSQKAVNEQKSTKAQPETFTYATTKSGNTFVIPSNLSIEARQYYAKLGVATSSQPPTEASFAVDSDTQVIIDREQEQLTDWINETQVQDDIQTQIDEGVDVQPIQPDENAFTDNSIPKGDESTANDVQLSANTYGTEEPLVANPDENWAMGQNLYTGFGGTDSLDILNGTNNKTNSATQWMTQQNQNVVPRDTYQGMAQDGANGTTAMMDNFKASFEKITANKYFPIIVLGFVGLIVLSIIRGGKSSGGASAPPVQITRYG